MVYKSTLSFLSFFGYFLQYLLGPLIRYLEYGHLFI